MYTARGRLPQAAKRLSDEGRRSAWEGRMPSRDKRAAEVDGASDAFQCINTFDRAGGCRNDPGHDPRTLLPFAPRGVWLR